MLQEKEDQLIAYFREAGEAAIAFSGGVDSAYLLYAAGKSGAKVTAYYVKAAFQPEFETQDACKLAEQLGCEMKILKVDVLACEEVAANPKNRCYFCKRQIFGTIIRAAAEDGHVLLCDGTNASDDAADRPGMVALQELSVQSPLRICGLTKAEIRELSKKAGLFTWDKPAYACLATRIPSGVRITEDLLRRTEWAEEYLFSLGFTDFRVRLLGDAAKLQIREDQLPLLCRHREAIVDRLKEMYSDVYLDLEVRG